MKNLGLLLMIVSAGLFSSCSNDSKVETTPVKEEVSKTVQILDKDYIISNSESVIGWEGNGVGHGHNGTVNIIAGKFSIENGYISKGKATIDMTSLASLDVKDPEEKGKLEGHLKNEDFFDVVKFPTSHIEIINAEDINMVKIALTIKDKTVEMEVPFKLTPSENHLEISSNFSIDRTDFGIQYNSKKFFDIKKLGDYMIEDEVKFDIKIVAK